MSAKDADQEERRHYIVLVNHEEQYCLWPKGKAVPDGWRADGMEGTRAECVAYVDETWLDMRPLSLRQAMKR
jgi:MbtH protein